MIRLADKWGPILASQPEAGMGYQVATVVLADGRRFEHAVIQEGMITAIGRCDSVPFSESEISNIIVTNDRWDTQHSEAPLKSRAGLAAL